MQIKLSETPKNLTQKFNTKIFYAIHVPCLVEIFGPMIKAQQKNDHEN